MSIIRLQLEFNFLDIKATVEANNLSAVAAAKETYYHLMEQICGSTKPYLEIDNLEVEHLRCSHQALEQFQKTPKMGGEQYSKSSLTQLQRVWLNNRLNYGRKIITCL